MTTPLHWCNEKGTSVNKLGFDMGRKMIEAKYCNTTHILVLPQVKKQFIPIISNVTWECSLHA